MHVWGTKLFWLESLDLGVVIDPFSESFPDHCQFMLDKGIIVGVSFCLPSLVVDLNI